MWSEIIRYNHVRIDKTMKSFRTQYTCISHRLAFIIFPLYHWRVIEYRIHTEYRRDLSSVVCGYTFSCLYETFLLIPKRKSLFLILTLSISCGNWLRLGRVFTTINLLISFHKQPDKYGLIYLDDTSHIRAVANMLSRLTCVLHDFSKPAICQKSLIQRIIPNNWDNKITHSLRYFDTTPSGCLYWTRINMTQCSFVVHILIFS